MVKARGLERFLIVSPGGMTAARRVGWLLLSFALAAPGAVHGAPVAVRLRWLPSATPEVVGYNVYVRALAEPYGAPRDAGLPVPASDGTLAHDVRDLDDTVGYAFVVTAYLADRSESGWSNERQFGPLATTTTTTSSTSSTTSSSTSTTRPSTTTTTSSSTSTSRPPTTTTTSSSTTTTWPTTTSSSTSTTRPSTTTTTSSTTSSTTRPSTTTTRPPTSTSSSTTSTSTLPPPPASTTTTTRPPAGAPACASDADCADADACTVGERCEAGRCRADALRCGLGSACETGRCDPERGCVAMALPDGSTCAAADPCDPGVCRAGACTPLSALGVTAAEPLRVSRFLLRPAGRRRRLLAEGSFRLRRPLDPTASGVTLELRTPEASLLYAAAVPADRFRAVRGRRGVRYVARGGRRGVPGTDGLTRLALVFSGEVADVRVAGVSRALAAAAARPSLAWSLRFGEACVRDPAVHCREPARGVTRCQ
jgi:hypothetical protein